MATDKSVNEESSAFLTVRFYDKNDELTTPSSIQYRLDCLTNNEEVRTWTALAPASVIEIGLDATDNAIVDQWNHTELRIITIEAYYGVSDKLTTTFKYLVKNLRKIT
jgi:hypothetical protein